MKNEELETNLIKITEEHYNESKILLKYKEDLGDLNFQLKTLKTNLLRKVNEEYEEKKDKKLSTEKKRELEVELRISETDNGSWLKDKIKEKKKEVSNKELYVTYLENRMKMYRSFCYLRGSGI